MKTNTFKVLSGQTIDKSPKLGFYLLLLFYLMKGSERRDLCFQVIHREDENCQTVRLLQSICVPLCETLDHMLVNDITE